MFWKTKTTPLSRLYNEKTFYEEFVKDLRNAKLRIIIESPFITAKRFRFMYPMLQKATKRQVKITVNTRNPLEHNSLMRTQSIESISLLQDAGITALYTTGLHRKLAIIDDIVWEGSLNILSQTNSCEMMRRTKSPEYANQLIKFIKMSGWYN